MNNKHIDLIVTRHPALVQYLGEIGFDTTNTEIITQATPEKLKGKHVAGVLPHALSCLCESFTEIPLNLPLEMRGVELTLEQLRKYAAPQQTYRVIRESSYQEVTDLVDVLIRK